MFKWCYTIEGLISFSKPSCNSGVVGAAREPPLRILMLPPEKPTAPLGFVGARCSVPTFFSDFTLRYALRATQDEIGKISLYAGQLLFFL